MAAFTSIIMSILLLLLRRLDKVLLGSDLCKENILTRGANYHHPTASAHVA